MFTSYTNSKCRYLEVARMVDFTERMRLKGKAEEDIYFAALNKKLIEALHEKQAENLGLDLDQKHFKAEDSTSK